MNVLKRGRKGAVVLLFAAFRLLPAQSTAPSVSQVLIYSTTGTGLASQGVPSRTNPPPTTTALVGSVSTIYSETKMATTPANKPVIYDAANYSAAQSIVQISNALNASIATALSVIPLASPASGTIEKTDAMGNPILASGTLGTIFTERAETIGKNQFFIGFTHQDYHFTELNGQSLNDLNLLYTGGFASNLTKNGQTLLAVPTTFSVGSDVRLSQDIAFLTYGVTNRFDVSLGLPFVHSAIAARTYNGQIWAGTGVSPSPCWCANTFTPGALTLYEPQVGQSSAGATGFGDLLLRLKGTVIERQNLSLAVGGDVRFATGDASNYLGTGTTSVKPFMALSVYTRPLRNGIIFAPHVNLGWQFSGKSILGGTLSGTDTNITLHDGSTFTYVTAPFTSTKDYLPDVFNWAVGSEIAFGRRFTVVADMLGNQLGWIHGIPNTMTQGVTNVAPPVPPSASVMSGTASGLVSAGKVSYGQYNGAFGWKAQIIGKLVLTFNALVRFDNNGLTARFAPLYGLGYTF